LGSVRRSRRHRPSSYHRSLRPQRFRTGAPAPAGSTRPGRHRRAASPRQVTLYSLPIILVTWSKFVLVFFKNLRAAAPATQFRSAEAAGGHGRACTGCPCFAFYTEYKFLAFGLDIVK